MNKANECTCPSGDGSLVHPCPAHPAVEQVGGDERAAFEAAFAAMGRPVCRADYDQDAYGTPFDDGGWTGWQARAALAQPSPTTDSRPAEWSSYDPTWVVDFIRDNSIFNADLIERMLEYATRPAGDVPQAEQAEAERPEVVAWRYGFSGGIVSDKACLDEWKSGGEYQSLMTVAQHERIVGELRAVIAQLRQHKNDYMDSGQETYRALQNEIREREAEIARLDGLVSGRTAERDAALAEVNRLRESKGDPSGSFDRCMRMMYERDENAKRLDAALARVAELEKQEPVATIAKVPGEDWNGLHFYRDLQGMQPGTKLYAAPVAQAQQLHDLDKQCRDDVARALGLRPSQERGFAWSYLLASIKSCVKAAEDTAQAQHSVPDVCDGKEQNAFEDWASKEGMNMERHPLHWLFLDAKTYSARQGWKAALKYARNMLAAAPVCRLSRSALTEAQMRRLYENSTETENERLGFEAFARLIRRAEAVHQITAAPGKEGV
ncbi:TPA: hypothetical protein ACKAEQ_002863 [Pseudomonas aeruginosa]|nr:hypothetical protein [Pseudomonas aeruginosa]